MEFLSPKNLKTDTSKFYQVIKDGDTERVIPMPLSKTTLIIAGFPGIGKSHEYRKYAGTGTVCIDSDSSMFHWIMTKEGKQVNPAWPDNYEINIISNIGEVDYLCVSTHKETIQILEKLEVPYILVYPKSELKDIYLANYKKRGNDEGFINLMTEKWDSFLSDMRKSKPFMRIELKKDEYLGDMLYAMEWEQIEKISDAWARWQLKQFHKQ